MTETYHAYLGTNPRPVHTFSDLDLAEPTTEEIEAELVRQQMESQP